MSGRFIGSGGTAGENNPGRKRATAKVGDVANAVIRKKDAQDPKARCTVQARCEINREMVENLPAPVAPVSKTFIRVSENQHDSGGKENN